MVLVVFHAAALSAMACAPTLVGSPSGQVVCAGSSPSISCTVTGANLVFSWQADAGQGFAAVTNDATYAGASTPTLTVSSVSTALNGRLYRCVVTNTCGAVTTGVATLHVSDPPSTSCTPTTINTGDYGTGIDRVQFGSIDHTHTANNNDGLSDFTCVAATVLAAGSTNALVVTLNGGNPEYCKVYIDYDGDGAFAVNELVMNSPPATLHSNQVVIAAFPQATDRLIRMRVISDFNPIADACTDVDYGEIEDFGVYIPAPPCSAPVVTADPSNAVACAGGNASFTCSMSGPSLVYQWQAEYGAGFVDVTNGGAYSGANSATLNLSSVPSSLDRYRFRCVVTNACGEAITGEAELMAGVPASSCSPATVNTGNFGTGIVRFQFNAIDNVHDDFQNDGTQDFTCSDNTVVGAGSTYAFTATLSGGNPEYCRIYIDYNNDGAYAAGEIVYNNNTTRQTSHSGNITIATSGAVTDELLRMRVISDFNTIAGGCNNVSYGEVEDYGIYIRSAPGQRATGLEVTEPTNLVFYTSGPNEAFTAEYTTNLMDPDAWQTLPGAGTVWTNGTNITTFGIPPNLPAAAIRFR